jgi:hypothetical protein
VCCCSWFSVARHATRQYFGLVQFVCLIF